MSSEQSATVVVAACIEQDGKLLLTKRFEAGEPSALYKWEFPGGVVLLGERLLNALYREVKEELGQVVKELPQARLVHSQVNRYDSGKDYLVLYFHCQVYRRIECPDPEKSLLLKPSEIVRDGTYPGFLPGTVVAASIIGKDLKGPPFSFVETDVTKQTVAETLHVLTYTLGNVVECYHKAKRYGATAYYSEANQKKEMSDLVSMCRLYCEQRNWSYEALMELGEEAYLDRMEDLKEHGV